MLVDAHAHIDWYTDALSEALSQTLGRATVRILGRIKTVCYRKIVSVASVVSCLVLVGIIGGMPAVSAAADPAIVLQSGLAVYSGPTESRAPVMNLPSGEELLTRVEIVDSQGTGWCDVLNKGDEAMLGYVRCEGLKILRAEMPENWRVVPAPEEVGSAGEEPQKSPAASAGTHSKAGSKGQSALKKPMESAPQ